MSSTSVASHRVVRRHVLVFEPDARGHAEEWLLHIVRFARDAQSGVKVTLAIPEAFARRIASEMAGGDCVDILPLAGPAAKLCLSANLALGAFARWWLMRRLLARSGADEGLFLCFDSLTLPFALGLGLGARHASGILFRPSVHYASFGRTPPTLGERVRDWRKRILYPLMLRNPALETVHSLDPYFPAYARARYVGGSKVCELPDPLTETAAPCSPVLRTPRIPSERVVFLLFGELTERKGIIQLLHACERLDSSVAARSAVLLTGRIDPAIANRVRELIGKVRAAQPDLWIEIDDRRLSFAELVCAVEACDVVLAPYQRFVGSSGVLIWAARMVRPVITQRYGLLWRLVRDYGLGIAVDTTSPEALATALEHATQAGAETLIDPHRARKFLARRDGWTFSAQLLGVQVEQAQAGEPSLTSSRARRLGAF